MVYARGKRSRLVGCALGLGALVIALSLVNFFRSEQRPVVLVFEGFTNPANAARPLATFVGTNTHSRPIRFGTHIERKDPGWPTYLGALPHNDSGWEDVAPSKQFKIVRQAPPGPAPWRLSLLYSILDDEVGVFRWRVAEFCYDHDLSGLGRLIHKGAQGQFVYGPEMEN